MAYRTDLTRTTDENFRPNSAHALSLARPADDTDTIRRQIDHTRTQMEYTLQAIGERLSPEALIEQAKSSAKDAASERIRDMKYQANHKVEGMTNSLSQTIRENPLPVALIGLGLGWLWKSSRDQSSADVYRDYRYRGPEGFRRDDDRYYYDTNEGGRLDEARDRIGDMARSAEYRASNVAREAEHRVADVADAARSAGHRASEAVQSVGEAVSDRTQRIAESAEDAVHRTGEAIGETAENIQERVGETAEAVQQRAERAKIEAQRLRYEAERRGRMAVRRTSRSFNETLEENPLMVAAVAALAGVAVGASMPATRYENELLGETRDQFLDEAKTRAQDAVGRVQAVVEDTQRAVVTEAKQSAQRHNLTIDDLDGSNGVDDATSF